MEIESAKEHEEDPNKPTAGRLLRLPRFTLAAISSSLTYFLCCFTEPILALRLLDFELDSLQIGMFFAIWAVFYIPSSFLVQYLPRKVSKRITIITSTFFCGIAFLFFGPSLLLNMPDSLVVMGIG